MPSKMVVVVEDCGCRYELDLVGGRLGEEESDWRFGEGGDMI